MENATTTTLYQTLKLERRSPRRKPLQERNETASPTNVSDGPVDISNSSFDVLIKAVDQVTRTERRRKELRDLYTNEELSENHEDGSWPVKRLKLNEPEPENSVILSKTKKFECIAITTQNESNKVHVPKTKAITISQATQKKTKKSKAASTDRIKHPGAPKRFKSPYIFFSMAKKQEVERSLGPRAQATEVTQRIAKLWREITPNDREIYNIEAQKDKERYKAEKDAYKGPWTLPKPPRKRKDPTAPKRSPSAFLFYAQDRRKRVKAENPGMSFQDVSRLMGEMWKREDNSVKQPYIEREQLDRAKYNRDTADWKRRQELLLQQDRNDENDDECDESTEKIGGSSLREGMESSKCAIGSNSRSNDCSGGNSGTKTFLFNKSKENQPLNEIICNEEIPDLNSSTVRATSNESPMTCSIPIPFNDEESSDSLTPTPTHVDIPKTSSSIVAGTTGESSFSTSAASVLLSDESLDLDDSLPTCSDVYNNNYSGNQMERIETCLNNPLACNEDISIGVPTKKDLSSNEINQKENNIISNDLHCKTGKRALQRHSIAHYIDTQLAKASTKDEIDDEPRKSKVSKKKKLTEEKAALIMRKHPLAPKRFKTAYIMFCDDKRHVVRESLGSATSGTRVTKALGAWWKRLTDKEREYWSRRADDDMRRYKTEMKKYDGPYFTYHPSPISCKRKKKDPDAPKKYASAFIHFSRAMRSDVKNRFPDLTFEDISMSLSNTWKALSDVGKKPYLDLESADRKRYDWEMGRWKSSKAAKMEREKLCG